jgi:hypothetical protein
MASFRGEMRGKGKEEDEVEEREEEEEGGGGDAFVLPCGGAAVDCRLREEGKSYLVLLPLLSERREAGDGGGKRGGEEEGNGGREGKKAYNRLHGEMETAGAISRPHRDKTRKFLSA